MATTTDKRFYQLTLAIQKAINAIETPVKEKHVRSTLIGTFKEQSAVTYWMVAIRLPIQENRIVAWKFCHVTHKLLREGHPACLDDSQRHIGMIENLGKLWVHLREGYGKLVHLYCNLLVCKLKFHSRNPRFPGNMQLTADELDAIAENDVNNYFQLCVELFDYMDEILNLQASVFDSLGNARANSMTASGQCRLAALIPCAQDASQIYDCNVRLLFRLHASLPAETLSGHRERFRQQFKKLSSFYKHASSLQYYRNLLTLPVLPSNPPNFLIQSDFGTYVTPVVSIPEPPPDEPDAVGALIDTSDIMSQTTSDHSEDLDVRVTPSPQPDPIVERDRLNDHLQQELKRMRSEVSQLLQEKNVMLSSMKEHCTRLESHLHTAKAELEEERQRAEILSVQAPEIERKLTETAEKAKVQDEKFQKLKGAYTQLREEHITLIRQKAEVDKLSANLRASVAQHESAKLALQQQLNDRVKDVELLQQSASSSEEIEAYKSELSSLRSDLEQSRQKEIELETLRGTMEALEIDFKTAAKEQEDKLSTVTNELKETVETLDAIKKEKEERETELARVKEELVGLRQKSGDEYKKVVEEKEAALNEVAELKQQHLQEKEEVGRLNNQIHELQSEIDNLHGKITVLNSDHIAECQNLNQEFSKKKEDAEQLLSDTESKLHDALEKIESLEKDLEVKVTDIVNLNSELAQLKEIEEKNTEYLDDISQLTMNLKELEEKSNQDTVNINENLMPKIDEQIQEIDTLKKLIAEKDQISEENESKVNSLTENIAVLTSTIEEKSNEITELHKKLNEDLSNHVSVLQSHTDEYENSLRELNLAHENLKNELESVIKDKEEKEEKIKHLESLLNDKESDITSSNAELSKLSEEMSKIKDELTETMAELEIANGELIDLKELHDKMLDENENNLFLKNVEVNKLSDEKEQLEAEVKNQSTKINIISSEKQVLEKKLSELTEAFETLKTSQRCSKLQNDSEMIELNSELDNLRMSYNNLKDDKETEIKLLNDKIADLQSFCDEEVEIKNKTIIEAEEKLQVVNQQLGELKQLVLKERDDMNIVLSNKDHEMQMLENRLEHVESKRLNAECELQDLLQHNTVLETDLAAIKKQLQDTQKALEKQTSLLVSCAGDAALQVTKVAIAVFDQANTQDSISTSADQAAKALEQLAANTNVSGNEESVAKSTIFAAHNVAQLSTYVADVSNTSTDLELSDKLNNECRSMLTGVQECLESIKNGTVVSASCIQAKSLVRAMMTSAAAANKKNTGARSVDDELADMDRAIEEAASQIESMLAATRAGESGVKLEVNGKILDACTTLMGAVKILVQDARKLQNELGDPTTRQKMYRKNPQWSQGLISAAKAVVFAAKLLVTSADEAVGASGQVEGVSAAAHEVAGSTAQLVAASRARAPPDSPALTRLTNASRHVAAATGALVAAVKAGSTLVLEQEALDTSSLSLTATRRLEMESKVRSLKLETALDAERARLAALRKRHYQLAQKEENGNMENGKD